MSSSVPLPPPYDCLSRHSLLPEPSHDDSARMNFLANMNVHIGAILFPSVSISYEAKVKPSFEKEHGREPGSAVEVRDAMKSDTAFQTWSALRRNTQEARQQVGRSFVYKQLDTLVDRAKTINAGSNRLRLDESVEIPRYLSAADNHLMPGSYYTEVVPDDISAPANYESGHYTTVAGGTGPKSDLVGRTMAEWLKDNHPDFSPKRIVDIGAGAGFNTIPLAEAYPDAEVWVVDVAAPMLRYGHARAKEMGVENMIFQQADAETVDIEDGSVDLVISAMFFHETSTKAMAALLKKTRAMLKPGGLMLHMEQPNFDPDTTPFEKFVRDWDCWYNAEPFWAKLHTIDVIDEMVAAGFDREETFETSQPIDRYDPTYPEWAGSFSRHAHEAKMREGAEKPNPKKSGGIYMFGATKQQ
jgi:ubiquinone/menaquinone biosynthesis C-methylase UbiE